MRYDYTVQRRYTERLEAWRHAINMSRPHVMVRAAGGEVSAGQAWQARGYMPGAVGRQRVGRKCYARGREVERWRKVGSR